jgi:hypothetical protein
MTLRIVPISFSDAAAFVAEHHRHHAKPVGHKFSLGVADDALLVGVAIVGRPVSRILQAQGGTLEVIRTATDGTRNANSMLYGACCKVTFGLGYDRLITYTQEGESGASLRASGFRVLAERKARPGWDTPSRARTSKLTDSIPRTLWGQSKLPSMEEAVDG